MQGQIDIAESIKKIAANRFDKVLIQEFIETYHRLAEDLVIVGHILQISTDEGEELEIGFFTKKAIVDVTLSRGKVYSCSILLSSINEIRISDFENKWTLNISGEKKFDYNVLKPGSPLILENYERSLKRQLSKATYIKELP